MPRLLQSLRVPTVQFQPLVLLAQVFSQSRMGLPLQVICTNLGVPWLSNFTLTKLYITPSAKYAWVFTLLCCMATLAGGIIMLVSLFAETHTRSNLQGVSAAIMFATRTVLWPLFMLNMGLSVERNNYLVVIIFFLGEVIIYTISFIVYDPTAYSKHIFFVQ